MPWDLPGFQKVGIDGFHKAIPIEVSVETNFPLGINVAVKQRTVERHSPVPVGAAPRAGEEPDFGEMR